MSSLLPSFPFVVLMCTFCGLLSATSNRDQNVAVYTVKRFGCVIILTVFVQMCELTCILLSIFYEALTSLCWASLCTEFYLLVPSKVLFCFRLQRTVDYQSFSLLLLLSSYASAHWVAFAIYAIHISLFKQSWHTLDFHEPTVTARSV